MQPQGLLFEGSSWALTPRRNLYLSPRFCSPQMVIYIAWSQEGVGPIHGMIPGRFLVVAATLNLFRLVSAWVGSCRLESLHFQA